MSFVFMFVFVVSLSSLRDVCSNRAAPHFNIATYVVLHLKLLSGEGHVWHGVGDGQRAHGEFICSFGLGFCFVSRVLALVTSMSLSVFMQELGHALRECH